jgi:hypothetical protein
MMGTLMIDKFSTLTGEEAFQHSYTKTNKLKRSRRYTFFLKKEPN